MFDRIYRRDGVGFGSSAGRRCFRRNATRFVHAGTLLAAVALTVGCGPETKPTSTTSDTAAEAPSSATPEATTSSTVAGEKDRLEGMQMPAVPVPAAPDPSTPSGGPIGLGEGGLEMPDIPVAPGVAPPSEKPANPENFAVLADWQTIESTAKSTGKVTVVDLWSLACEPCLKEFPGLVRLDQTLGSEVACIGVSLDFDGRKSKPAETYQTRVDAFLRSTGAAFANFICRTPSDEVYERLKLLSLPAVLVFDQDGKLIREFVDGGETKGFGYESDIIPYVESLLDAG